MEISNADWRIVKDSTGQVSLYEHGNPEPVLVVSKQKFLSLGALVEQVIAKGG